LNISSDKFEPLLLYCKTATVGVLNSFRKTNILYKFNLVDKVKQAVYI